VYFKIIIKREEGDRIEREKESSVESLVSDIPPEIKKS